MINNLIAMSWIPVFLYSMYAHSLLLWGVSFVMFMVAVNSQRTDTK